MNASARLVTPPPSGRGAIAAVELTGEVEPALRAIGVGGVEVGTVALREIAGVDRGLVARWTPSSATLMPHGGKEVVRRILEAAARAGIAVSAAATEGQASPEGVEEIEARMVEAVAQAASPLALDVLLEQPERWRRFLAAGGRPGDPRVATRSMALNRLISPPLVVVAGGPNIGKSSLLNALAGRETALVADHPGTTRDHVGAALNLSGLVVRWVDTPGLEATPADSLQQEAQSMVGLLAGRCDLLVLAADTGSDYPELAAPTVIRVGLRADLGRPRRGSEFDVSVMPEGRQGLEELAVAIRECLVPSSLLEDDGPWRFW